MIPHSPISDAQFKRLVLDVTGGFGGYRLAFRGGVTFDPVLDPATDAPLEWHDIREAREAMKEAIRLWAEWEAKY